MKCIDVTAANRDSLVDSLRELFADPEVGRIFMVATKVSEELRDLASVGPRDRRVLLLMSSDGAIREDVRTALKALRELYGDKAKFRRWKDVDCNIYIFLKGKRSRKFEHGAVVVTTAPALGFGLKRTLDGKEAVYLMARSNSPGVVTAFKDAFLAIWKSSSLIKLREP